MKRFLLVISVVVLIPVVALFGLWLYGLRAEAGHYGAGIDIARPAAEIWPYLTRVEQLKKWQSGVEDVKAQDAVLAQGSKAQVVARGQPEEAPLTMDVTVKVADAPKKLVLAMSSYVEGVGFAMTQEQRLDERAGTTRVSIVGETTYSGFLPRLFEPLISGGAQKKLEEDLRRLKELVESETQGAPSPQDAGTVVASPVEEAEAAPAVVDAGSSEPTPPAPTETFDAGTPSPPGVDAGGAGDLPDEAPSADLDAGQ